MGEQVILIQVITGTKFETEQGHSAIKNGIKQKVDNGKFAVAFILKPIPISALKEVADNNRFMPPKSTYIEPKLRSGLTIYSLD